MLCNPLFISGSCSYSSAAKAFIFSLHNTNGYVPVKLLQYQHLNKAMYSCTNYGPTFGGNLGQHDIYTPNDAVNTQTAFTYCGSTYSLPPGNAVGHCAFFAGESSFTPTDIEVFYETTSWSADHLSLFQVFGQWGDRKSGRATSWVWERKLDRAALFCFFFSPRPCSSPAPFFGRSYWPRAWNRLLIIFCHCYCRVIDSIYRRRKLSKIGIGGCN